MIDIKKVRVKKRDGRVEEFSEEKIKKVVVAAGLSLKQAEKLVPGIVKWVEQGKKEVLSSLEIRDKIIEEMKKVDDYAYQKYIWWEKYKDNHFNK